MFEAYGITDVNDAEETLLGLAAPAAPMSRNESSGKTEEFCACATKVHHISTVLALFVAIAQNHEVRAIYLMRAIFHNSFRFVLLSILLLRTLNPNRVAHLHEVACLFVFLSAR